MIHREVSASMFTTGLATVLLLTLFGACSGVVSSKSYISKGPSAPPKPSDEVKVFWREHGVPDPATYELLGTNAAKAFWCQSKPARLEEAVHKYLIEDAGKRGGDGVILYCGEVGTTGGCFCYGDVILFHK